SSKGRVSGPTRSRSRPSLSGCPQTVVSRNGRSARHSIHAGIRAELLGPAARYQSLAQDHVLFRAGEITRFAHAGAELRGVQRVVLFDPGADSLQSGLRPFWDVVRQSEPRRLLRRRAYSHGLRTYVQSGAHGEGLLLRSIEFDPRDRHLTPAPATAFRNVPAVSRGLCARAIARLLFCRAELQRSHR